MSYPAPPAPTAPSPVAAKTPPLGLYAFLARGKGPRSYIGKILLVAFLGTHIPLLTLLAHFIITNSLSASATSRALTVALIATLAGTGLTLFALTQLLKPILLTRRGLRHYLSTSTIPNLPTEFSDDAGGLMADTQQAIEKLDNIIVHLAHYDALTLLPNKKLFEERVKQATFLVSSNTLRAVLVIDIDGLKNVNDLYGPQIGDRFIKTIASRLAQTVEGGDMLARIGGDEFALLQMSVASNDAVIAQARRLSEAVAGNGPLQIDEYTVHPSVSIGIALFSGSDASNQSAHLLRDAEAAMYQAKKQGNGNCHFYSPEINEQMRRLLACDHDLRGALERGEFVLHYQPQVDLTNGEIIGVEALLRWNHPERGLVPPSDFIPVAEQNGLIVPIGEWAMKTACQQNKAWQDAGLTPVRVAVNLSARQFHNPHLVERVGQILQETGLAPQWLELEITESLALGSEKETIDVLHQLRAMGVALSLDDFGTGYSSLSQLKRFPLHTLKIDRSFLHDVSANEENAAIVAGIIGLAHNLRLSVVAEGVETDAQAAFLQESGCEVLQGFLFSRPVPADNVATLLQESAVFSIK